MIRRKRRPPMMIPLASMGDIAFLLIIFFMLNATFMKDGRIQLEPAESRDLQEVETAPISVSIDVDGVSRLQGAEMTPGSLETAVANLLAGRDDRVVRLRVDRNLPKRVYLPVIEALSRAGATLQVTGVQLSGDNP